MNRIKQIRFKNFKYFYDVVPIDIERNNVLIFGENGSGKSSIYWGVYTFLQSIFKADSSKVQKYFNPRHDENLRNRFAADADESFIKIVFEDQQQSITEKTISNSVVNTRTGNLITQATLGSDLINYKLLSKVHDFKNPFQINLFPIIDRDSLMFINFREDLVRHDGQTGTANAQDWWEYIKPGLQPRGRMHDPEYKTFAAAVDKFNQELKFYLASIIESVNDYLKRLKQPFTVSFDVKDCTYDAFEEGSSTRRNHKTIPPRIFVHAHFNHEKLDEGKKLVSRPHTFLNEAKLTAIALSIRFAMLDEKIDSSQLSEDTPKLLILDDLLISLDMSNRETVLDIVFKEFTNYQLLFLTHDKNFFEFIRHKIKRYGQDNWIYYEMYESIKDDIPQPLIFESDSYLGQAEYYLKKGKYEIAGNLLRKEAEYFIKNFLPDSYKLGEYGQLKPLAVLLNEAELFSNQSGINPQLFKDLNTHTKFLLNHSSHNSFDVPLFKSEITNCISTLHKIHKIKNESFLERGEQLEFDLTTADGNDVYKFEIVLEDDFRLLKEPENDSVISKGNINYWVTTNGTKGDLQHSKESLDQFYSKNYDKSDKTKDSNFWESIIISSSGRKLSSVRVF